MGSSNTNHCYVNSSFPESNQRQLLPPPPPQQQQMWDYWDHSAFHNPAGSLASAHPFLAAAGSGTPFVDYQQQPQLLPPANFPFYVDQGVMPFVKNEDAAARIGLNLGYRTYFSSGDAAAIDRLFRRSRGLYPVAHPVPRCQAEGCKADLSGAKHYHRRHKVCEFHSKATVVVAGGLQQRFCQQCSRFHVLSEFDEAKRSCRKRLADHNRRRRKPQQAAGGTTTQTSAENNEEEETNESAELDSKGTTNSSSSSSVQNTGGGGAMVVGTSGSGRRMVVESQNQLRKSAALSLGGGSALVVNSLGGETTSHHHHHHHHPRHHHMSSSSSFFPTRHSPSSFNEAASSSSQLGQALFELDFM